MFGGVEDEHKIWDKHSFSSIEFMKHYDQYPDINRVFYLKFAIIHIDEVLELIKELYDNLRITQMYDTFRWNRKT